MSSFCIVCENPVDQFLTHGLPPRPGVCPHCKAKARHREMAFFYLEKLSGKPGEKILEVGPSAATTKLFINPRFLKEAHYTAIDVRTLKHHGNIKAPHRFQTMDATRLEWAEQTFDYVFCNHVLPYIEQDVAALSELRRVLKKDGVAVLNSHMENKPQTRRMEDLKKENPQKYTDEFLVENGTVWEYGEDYLKRLESAGFIVEQFDITQGKEAGFISHNGLKTDSRIILGFKTAAARDAFLAR